MESQLVLTLLDGMPWPAIIIDKSDHIVATNALARTLFGTGIEGRHYILTLRQPGLLEAIEITLRDRQPTQARHIITGPSREITYRVQISPVAGEGQQGALCVFEDITDAEQIGQIRRDFVANVSHELRTPLTALLGFIETLRGAARDDSAARERFLAIMEREAGRMNRLVRDLLHLSRVEAEERVRPTTYVDLTALINMAVASLKPVADDAGVVVQVTGDSGPLKLPADADQLTQVFHNLIENAIKYGSAGKVVTIDISNDPRDPNLRLPAVRVDVKDRGEGIDPKHLPRLAERFYRVDSHRSREKGGTGLGLAIVKHIVSRHRGRLLIESDLGKGSVFSVILPSSAP
jgi:two-component system, OmpR family, phosphate regulon sensor histidine kinase PhoR